MTDEEYLNRLNKIEIYSEILLGVLRYIPVRNYKDNNDYKQVLNKNLKFENDDGHLRLRACIDLIEDSQTAISEFNKNGLATKSENLPEMYLRLYGVLNAVYLQKQSIIELIELFKIPNKRKIIAEFQVLKIIELRNKIGAHTLNYKEEIQSKTSRIEYYRLTQSTISKWGNGLVLVSNYDKIYNYDLKTLINEFTGYVEFYLDSISGKALKSLFPNESEGGIWMMNRLNFVRNKKTNKDLVFIKKSAQKKS